MTQFYFEKGIYSLSKALYHGIDCQTAQWTKEIASWGSSIMARLNLMFSAKDGENRAHCMKMIFERVNKANVDLVMRLKWYISKAEL